MLAAALRGDSAACGYFSCFEDFFPLSLPLSPFFSPAEGSAFAPAEASVFAADESAAPSSLLADFPLPA
jgi:hypothetical protein